MIWLKTLLTAGRKFLIPVLLALAVIWILFYVIQSTQERERDKNTIELQDKQIEKRTKIDRAVRNQQKKDVEDSLDYLRRRQ